MARRRAPRVALATLNYPPDRSGIARAAARLVKTLCGAGYEVTVFAPRWNAGESPGPVAEERVLRVPIELPALSAFTEAVLQEHVRAPFDVFHGFFLQMAYAFLHEALHRARKRPVLASIRGIDAVWMQELYKATSIAILRQAACVTSVSTESLLAADRMIDIEGRSLFLPNSIDAARYPLWKRTSANQGTVGTVAIFRSKKGIPELVQAYGLLDRALRKRLLLVGEYESDPEGQRVRTATADVIARYDLAREVLHTGFVPHAELGEQLTRLRVFVVPSHHEGLPNAMLEAAAAGVPIVATAVDGSRDVLRHGHSALLVPPQDVRALSHAIERVLSSPELADRLSRGARRLARRLSPESEQRAWLSLYRRFAGPA